MPLSISPGTTGNEFESDRPPAGVVRFRFVDASHIIEADLDILLGIDLGLALAHGHEAAPQASGLTEAPLQEHPEGEDEGDVV